MHHIYYVLAAFDLLAVFTGLFLSHQLMQIHTDSVDINKTLAIQLRNFTKLGEYSHLVDGPGNDIFESRDVANERLRAEAGHKTFTSHLEVTRAELVSSGQLELMESLDRIENGMASMAAESEFLYSSYAAGRIDEAAAHMSAMDRSNAALTREVNAAVGAIQRIQAEHLSQQTSDAQTLRKVEYLLGVLFCLHGAGDCDLRSQDQQDHEALGG